MRRLRASCSSLSIVPCVDAVHPWRVQPSRRCDSARRSMNSTREASSSDCCRSQSERSFGTARARGWAGVNLIWRRRRFSYSMQSFAKLRSSDGSLAGLRSSLAACRAHSSRTASSAAMMATNGAEAAEVERWQHRYPLFRRRFLPAVLVKAMCDEVSGFWAPLERLYQSEQPAAPQGKLRSVYQKSKSRKPLQNAASYGRADRI
jgi:hypothetical protein